MKLKYAKLWEKEGVSFLPLKFHGEVNHFIIYYDSIKFIVCIQTIRNHELWPMERDFIENNIVLHNN